MSLAPRGSILAPTLVTVTLPSAPFNEPNLLQIAAIEDELQGLEAQCLVEA